MTLRAKHRRNIVVAGRRYHWAYHPWNLWVHDTYVVCQCASGRGGKLLLQHIGGPLPRSIAQAIEFALAHGWSPDDSRDMELGVAPHHQPGEYNFKPPGAGRFWFCEWWHARYAGGTG